MTPQTTPDIQTRHKLEPDCIIHAPKGLDASGWHQAHDTWKVLSVKCEQKDGDAAPRDYMKLQSVNCMDGLRFLTAAFDAETMQVLPPPDRNPKPLAYFPQPGSQVHIKSDNEDSFEKLRNGLWEVERYAENPRADGAGTELVLNLRSLDKPHPAFIKVAFNNATMRPVMPAYVESGVSVTRDVAVMKPAQFKKRNAAP